MLTTSWAEPKQAKGADGIQLRMCSGLYTVYSVDAVAMAATFEFMPIKCVFSAFCPVSIPCIGPSLNY